MTTVSSPSTWLRGASEIAWRGIVIAAALLILGAGLWKLRVVFLPIFVALLLCSALAPLVTRLEARRWPPLLATWTVLLGAVLVIGGLFAVIIPPTVAESDAIVESVSTGVVDIENWLVDGPLDVDRAKVREYTENPGERVSELLKDSSASLMKGARTVGEVLTGALLALILTLLFLKDGRKFQRWSFDHLPPRHHDFARAAANKAWGALSGYLRGAALLGFVEGIIIGITLWIVGSPLWAPVAVFTVLAAFFPVVGAAISGTVAELVALASGGPADAFVVLIVAVVVQQLDNDFLAPIIYGRSLELHAAVILIALTGGAVLGGIAGAFLAVPVTGAVFGVANEAWTRFGRPWADQGRIGPDDSGHPLTSSG